MPIPDTSSGETWLAVHSLLHMSERCLTAMVKQLLVLQMVACIHAFTIADLSINA